MRACGRGLRSAAGDTLYLGVVLVTMLPLCKQAPNSTSRKMCDDPAAGRKPVVAAHWSGARCHMPPGSRLWSVVTAANRPSCAVPPEAAAASPPSCAAPALARPPPPPWPHGPAAAERYEGLPPLLSRPPLPPVGAGAPRGLSVSMIAGQHGTDILRARQGLARPPASRSPAACPRVAARKQRAVLLTSGNARAAAEQRFAGRPLRRPATASCHSQCPSRWADGQLVSCGPTHTRDKN